MTILQSHSNTEMHFKSYDREKSESLANSKVLGSLLEVKQTKIENSIRIGQKMP
jgi:hypothetical protein